MNTLNIATTSTRNREEAKLLIINAEKGHREFADENARISHLERNAFVEQFRVGDVLVVNAAATLPASFMGIHRESGAEIELRLAQNLAESPYHFSHWKGFLFGKGNWRLPTEERTNVVRLQQGDRLSFQAGLQAEILAISPKNQRFIEIKFLSRESELLHQMYQAGRLIQYSYLEEELELWDGQTIFAGKPIALEAPSAAFPLTWETVLKLRKKGVQVVPLFHAAGISSTGEKELDAMLPLPEHYQIPAETATVINQAKQEQRRIIALGTSVTRALESAATQDRQVQPGVGIATLLLKPSHERKIVTALMTGLHEDGTSHLQLLQCFAPWNLIKRAYTQAKKLGYLWHEYGDSCLIFA